ncbi:lysophospholipid acyltransferase family protein [Herbaspirillum huttiense F1]|jgi:KDO2-lipid IV(A) lauroyltransferase|uniref:Lysophospholipid acyltransferase family protein n=3 Tax=Herbaspirillum huttiense TaxID=863372 RepID=A0AAJ2H8V8_9BURK|nr:MULTISPECIES: lysophospholipid acyltransferase family protein [Herbaspirillum]MBP1317588.1 KDO2-lipid IV(A) lauroyltransferase [Herbaspirillum sp. 1130]MCO4857479.1 lysophospholipid acyltransferase family protein [Herbaspirillum sp. WGmk3]MDR6742463.1 KDO2-lipid IV(A) lauroyltransferase [Herbaspirillum sp. 1173]MDR9839077.1 lysophospholipid acyltransferase family protein [Herbaspirillum huttiense]MDR9851879.1 lysophospholipid acyltransferase family protein [Herbaspirillum huttiense SE1]
MLVSLFRLLSFLPLPALHALGVVVGWLVFLLSPAYRRRLTDNITLAGHRGSLWKSVGEAGKGMFELPFIWCARPERVLRTARIVNWDLVQQALDAKAGIVFLTPHLGCFEISAQSVARHHSLSVLYRPPRKAALKPLIEGARARANLHLAPANLSGVRILLKALKNGQAIGLLPDQVPQNGEGVWANFFGKPAYTMTLPAKLQQMSGAPIILAYAERLSWGRGYAIHFVAFEGELGETPEQQARAINAAMEKLIARCPAQYIWSYNRYKTPPGVTPPGAAQ